MVRILAVLYSMENLDEFSVIAPQINFDIWVKTFLHNAVTQDRHWIFCLIPKKGKKKVPIWYLFIWGILTYQIKCLCFLLWKIIFKKYSLDQGEITES